jgi:hypothetical protein
MKIIGRNKSHSEFELDPVKAFHRGIALDAALSSAKEPHPRGVFRGDFAYFEKLDLLRIIRAARKLNGK